MLLVLCYVLPHWTNSHLKSSVLNSVSFLSSVLRSQIWHPKKKEQEQDVCVCVLLSTGYFSCQSQQELTVKEIRVGDAKHGQIHFINHNLLVYLRLATAITTFICFELVEKASLKLQLKSAVRESPLDFCTFLKVFQRYYRWLLFSRQTKTYNVPLVCSSFSRKKNVRHV